MNPDKKIIVDQLLQRLDNTPYLLLVDYTGLTMPQFNTIRKRLREVSANFHVTKNSYIKAVGDVKKFPEGLQKDLVGQTAVVFGDKDVCAAAKVIAGVNKEFKKPIFKSGILDGTLLSAAEVQGLADIGSRENLLAKLLGVLNAPAAAIARAIAAKIEKDGGGAPDTPPVTDDTPPVTDITEVAPIAEAA